MREWPEEKYGTFFSGDSYIILHTEKASPDSDVCICFQITFLELLVSLYKLIGKIIIAAKMDTNDTNASRVVIDRLTGFDCFCFCFVLYFLLFTLIK